MPKVAIVAGEASGDHHAADVIAQLRARTPDLQVRGIGGERMRAEGVEILVDSKEMAVVGLFEVLAHFGTIYGALQQMRQLLREWQPDLLILVDYPDFNLRLAKTAKELGIKVLYYISPQVWAWRQKRVYKIKRLVDMMAVVFPFEAPFYERAGVPVKFVGHPLADEIGSNLSRTEALSQFGLDPQRPTLGIFPGSRRSEVGRLLPLMLEAAETVQQQLPDLQILLPQASTLDDEVFDEHLQDCNLPITLIRGRVYDVMKGCDAIVSASGTATLEIALMETPLVVTYRIAPLSYRIMSRMIKVDHIALCNIVAGERMAPELIQDDATPSSIAEALVPLLRNESSAMEMREKMSRVREKLGSGDAAKNVAALALELIED